MFSQIHKVDGLNATEVNYICPHLSFSAEVSCTFVIVCFSLFTFLSVAPFAAMSSLIDSKAQFESHLKEAGVALI